MTQQFCATLQTFNVDITQISNHQKVVETVKKQFTPIVKIDGRNSQQRKQVVVELRDTKYRVVKSNLFIRFIHNNQVFPRIPNIASKSIFIYNGTGMKSSAKKLGHNFTNKEIFVLGRTFFRRQLLYWAVESFRWSKASRKEESRRNSPRTARQHSVHIALELVV